MEKANIMKTAHKIAKAILVRVKDYSIALSFALKLVQSDLSKDWTPKAIQEFLDGNRESYNAGIDKSNGVKNVEGQFENAEIPAWLISKNLTFEQQSAIKESYSRTIKRETAKAVLFAFDTAYGIVELWTPKSVLA